MPGIRASFGMISQHVFERTTPFFQSCVKRRTCWSSESQSLVFLISCCAPSGDCLQQRINRSRCSRLVRNMWLVVILQKKMSILRRGLCPFRPMRRLSRRECRHQITVRVEGGSWLGQRGASAGKSSICLSDRPWCLVWRGRLPCLFGASVGSPWFASAAKIVEYAQRLHLKGLQQLDPLSGWHFVRDVDTGEMAYLMPEQVCTCLDGSLGPDFERGVAVAGSGAFTSVVG